MLYIVRWSFQEAKHRSPSQFATWDGKVTDASAALRWAVGEDISILIAKLRDYDATVTLVDGSWHVRHIGAQLSVRRQA